MNYKELERAYREHYLSYSPYSELCYYTNVEVYKDFTFTDIRINGI